MGTNSAATNASEIDPLGQQCASSLRKLKIALKGFESRRLQLSRFARSFVGGVCRQVAPSFGLATVLESRRHQGVGGRWPPVDGVGVEPGAGVAEGPGDAEGAGVGVGAGAGDGAGGGADTGLSPIATSKLSKAKTS